MDTGMWPESWYYGTTSRHKTYTSRQPALVDSRYLHRHRLTCWFIYKVWLHSHRHISLNRDLIIIFAANHCGGGQMVKSISWLLPGTIGQWEGLTCAYWPMKGLRTCSMCWHMTWTQAERWKFFGPGRDVFNMSSDSFLASDWLNCTLLIGHWERQVFLNLLTSTSRALWSHKAGDCQ